MKTFLATIITIGIIIAVIIGLQMRSNPTDQSLSFNYSTEQSGQALQANVSNLFKDNSNNTPEQSEKITMQKATFTTNFGTIVIELDTVNTPATAENFKKLASQGFYNGTRFHRIIDGFMIQGGDPQSADVSKKDLWGTGGPGYQFADEIKPTNNNAVGTISMANAGPNTNGSQFFINTADNNFLDPKHTVFGKVISGMDVVEKISQTPTGQNDRPINDVIINSITVE